MNNNELEEAKRTLDEICKTLEDDTLSKEQREELEMHAFALAGKFASPWLPVDVARRLIVVGIIGLGVYGFIVNNYQVFIWWVALPFFSPRIMGETAYWFGKLRGIFRT